MEPHQIGNYVNEINAGIPIKETFDLVFWIMMVVNLVIFAFVRTINPGYITVLFNTAINNRQLYNSIREDLDLGKLSSILLNITYFNALAVIISRIIQVQASYLPFALVGFLIFAALMKLLVIRIIAFLLNSKLALQEHLLNHLLFFQIAGIVLTPILIFTNYIPERYTLLTLIILFSMVGIFLLIRELKSLTRALQYKISFFYIILYLCTLELLPLLIGIRVFILNSET